MKQRSTHDQGLQEAIHADRQRLTIRERAERLYLMGELEAAAELLLLEATR